MKQKLLFFSKTLLVVALLGAGSVSAWGAEPTLTLTASYAVDNYSKLCYLEFGAKTIDDGSTYADVVNVGGYTESATRGIQNQTSSSTTTPITITKSIQKGDLIVMQAGQTATYGMSITVGSAVSNPIKNDGYYVYYVTADAESFTVKLNRLNYVRAMLILRPSTTNYVVNAVTSNGTLLKELATGTYSEDATVYYPYGIMKDGVCYAKAKNGSEPYWGFTNIAAGLRTIVYTANDWAYYSEMEDMNGASLGGTRYSYANRASYGDWKWMNKNAKMYSSGLTAGTYSITIYGRNSKNTAQTPPVVILRSPGGAYTGTVAKFSSWDGSSTKEYTVNNVIIPEDDYAFCLFQVDYTSNIDLDYVYAVKTSDNITVSNEITSAGWATYCSPYALDLENATNLDDAFIVTGGADGVLTKTSVKGGTVPANTGLLLKGTEGSAVEVTIPVVANSETDVNANKLVGVTENTTLTANGVYVLMASPALGFYLNTNAFTVGANTAYLPAGFDGTSARDEYFFDFDNATGIDAAEKTAAKAGAYYNLRGQRIEKPSKGLYIVNGKKVIK